MPPSCGLESAIPEIMKMVDGYLKATCPHNLIGAFRRAGIAAEGDPGRRALRAKVVWEGAENVRHNRFKKTWIVVEDEQ
jgi:hypothetical protein